MYKKGDASKSDLVKPLQHHALRGDLRLDLLEHEKQIQSNKILAHLL